MRMNLKTGKKKMNKKQKNEWNALYFWGVSFRLYEGGNKLCI